MYIATRHNVVITHMYVAIGDNTHIYTKFKCLCSVSFSVLLNIYTFVSQQSNNVLERIDWTVLSSISSPYKELLNLVFRDIAPAKPSQVEALQPSISTHKALSVTKSVRAADDREFSQEVCCATRNCYRNGLSSTT